MSPKTDPPATSDPDAEPGRRSSLVVRATLLVWVLLAVATVSTAYMERWIEHPIARVALALAVLLPAAAYAVRRAAVPIVAMFRALAGTVSSFRDGDFSFSLVYRRRDELGELVRAHNELGDTLRQQRLGLTQRELLLDTMVQNTPVAMLLCGPRGRIVYANLTARKLLGGGRRMEGHSFDEVLEAGPEPLREAVHRGGDGLFVVDGDPDEEIYYLARRSFRLNGREHELFVLRHMTSELRRQEVNTWKKVIRVISHELNNSLAPVASLAHSGAELVRRGDHDRLEEIFDTIAERARHLEGFIRGYARFAKLPRPNPSKIDWKAFTQSLRGQIDFSIDGSLPDEAGCFDRAQLEQAVLNLLRNAHDSGSPGDDVTLSVLTRNNAVAIEVADRGPGMSQTVLENALLPFYSTKRGGTGLGLALVREIAEAHGGRVALANRDGGGLLVSVVLPNRAAV